MLLDVTNSYYMLCSVVTCYQGALHAVPCCYMFWVITCCAVLLRVISSYYMMCSVVPCWQGLLHVVQCCYTWHCVVEFCTAVLYVVMCSCMLCSVVHMLPRVIICCAVLFDLTKSYYILSSVVACNLELLHAMRCCYMLPMFIICCPVLLNFI